MYCRQAIEPPGQAKSDLDIFLDYAERMKFKDRDGEPLIKWKDPKSAFNAWCKFTKGWFCDYSGLTYKKLEGSGIQWPCNAEYPDGCERLYSDFKFRTEPELCESFGHDLELGATVPSEVYKAQNPQGRALLKAANYVPPLEVPDQKYPYTLMTGRLIYHFHTRTKTAHSPELQQAAPDVFAQISETDAKKLGVAEGDLLAITSARGTVKAKARVGGIVAGHVFVPFHYGYWDDDGDHTRAANELTPSEWDPISKQPLYKGVPVNVAKADAVGVGAKIASVAAEVVDQTKEVADKVAAQSHMPRHRVADAFALVIVANQNYIKACDAVGKHHFEDSEVRDGMRKMQKISEQAIEALDVFVQKYGKHSPSELTRLAASVTPPLRAGQFGLLRDIQNLSTAAAEVHVVTISLQLAARALHDEPLLECLKLLEEGCKRQVAWLHTHLEFHSAEAIVTKY
jgi:ferredoxin-nitrate reductase